MPELSLFECLDGQVGATLRETVPLGIRRELGAFFSDSDLRTATLPSWSRVAFTQESVLDPAVGAGDLLLEAARKLPVNPDLLLTLQQWGPLLQGRDIEPTFVRLAKARLVILAIFRGATGSSSPDVHLDCILPEIRVGDGLDLLRDGWTGGHIVMNPPFTYHCAPRGTTWTGGADELGRNFSGYSCRACRTWYTSDSHPP